MESKAPRFFFVVQLTASSLRLAKNSVVVTRALELTTVNGRKKLPQTIMGEDKPKTPKSYR